MSYLAIDFGASSGRAMLADFDGERITMTEIHRFENEPVQVGGTLYWDALKLFSEVKTGIAKALAIGTIDSMGIDTWGVDFGLINKRGDLVGNPTHYRDSRTDGIPEEVFELLSKSDFYSKTGIQTMQINTVFQLYSMLKNDTETMSVADKLLFMPDLFSYFLTGAKKNEYTDASTSQMLNAGTKAFDSEILEKVGIDSNLFCDMVFPGEIFGQLRSELCAEFSCAPFDVVAVPSHDTASAVVAVPTAEDDFIYVSCGTWSLLGTELDEPITGKKAEDYNFTNEGGAAGKIRFLKNIMGLWIFQDCRRVWSLGRDEKIPFPVLETEAKQSAPFKAFIDVDDPLFLKPGNMPEFVAEFCRKTGQYEPRTRGEVTRIIMESLAMKYRATIEQLKDCTGKNYKALHIVGGGTKSVLLPEWAANACNIKVIAGPTEATVLGNIAYQMIAKRIISDIKQARRVIAVSEEPKTYLPENTAAWDMAYERYLKVINL